MSSQSSNYNGYDLEDLLPRWLKNAYTTSHIQSALTALDERENARVRFRTESIQSLRSSNTERHLSPNANRPNSDASGSTKFYSIVSGTSPENMQRNRYMDVLPYDRTRVQVKVPHFDKSGRNPTADAEPDGLYLNANWVQERYGKKWWIASQAPLRNTAYTFLSMLLEDMYPPKQNHKSSQSRPRTVVQLTQNIESGRRKAHPYFPDVVGQTMIIVPDFTDYPPPSHPTPTTTSRLQRSKLKVTLVAQERINKACCVKSLSPRTPASIQFTHLLFDAWPDHSVPSSSDRAALFEFVRLVDRVNRQMPSRASRSERTAQTQTQDVDPDPPIIVGCSAGIGRTGSFIAMNSLLRHAGFLPSFKHSETLEESRSAPEQSTPSSQSPAGPAGPTTPSETPLSFTTPLGPLPATLSNDLVSQEIDSLREQRAGMVQRPEQAVLVYEMMVGAYVERGELKQ
ncbi:protein-tyrosine phosphatase-like protein [Lentinula raphanica]|nr:protein-tyrosine phosphatase-like protein [Lentinula raphanica]